MGIREVSQKLQIASSLPSQNTTYLLVADKCLDLTEVLSELLIEPVAYQITRIQLVTRQRILTRQDSSHLSITAATVTVVVRTQGRVRPWLATLGKTTRIYSLLPATWHARPCLVVLSSITAPLSV